MSGSIRFLDHTKFLELNFGKIATFYASSLAGMTATLVLIWFFYDGYQAQRLKAKPNSSATHYLTYIQANKTNKWLYYSYIMSILHALGCLFMLYLAFYSCEVPPQY